MNDTGGFFTDLGQVLDRHLGKQGQRNDPSEALARHPKRSRTLTRLLVPNIGTLILVLILMLTQNIWARPLQFNANAPGPSATTISYQGRLADNDGNPLTQQGVAMSFAIYDAETGGNLIWPASGAEAHVVNVSDGLFNVGLGSKIAIPPSVWNGDRYLEITVGGETLSPREIIRSVPIAGMALTVPDNAITNRNLNFSYWRADPIDSQPFIVNSQTWAAPDQVMTVDVDFPVAGTYLIFAKLISQAEAGEQIIAEIWDQNSRLPQARAFMTHAQGGDDGRETTTLVTMAPFPAGQHTIRLMAYMGKGDAGKIRGYSELYVIPFGQQ